MSKIAFKNDSYESVYPANSWDNNENHIESLLTHPWYQSMGNLLSCILDSSHKFFMQEGIKPLLFPITTGSVSSPMGKGSDSLPVMINLRGNNVYLADSMQFSLEIGTRILNKGCYYIMPTFRGENLDERHLNEFFHAEAEIEGSLDDVMGLIERYIFALAKYVRYEMHDVITRIAGTTEHLDALLKAPQKFFKKVRYEDAVKMLEKIPEALEDTGTGFMNITKHGERYLMNTFGEFTWLTNMPWANVPFYQAREENGEYAQNADLLAGIGEIVGCGQRVYSSDDLQESLDAHSVSVKGYEWYSQMRKIRPMQTSGFGLGIERFMLWVTKTDDIRDCMLLIRDHSKVCLP